MSPSLYGTEFLIFKWKKTTSSKERTRSQEQGGDGQRKGEYETSITESGIVTFEFSEKHTIYVMKMIMV